MELNKYQEQAMTTCMESSNNFSYMFLNLVGEIGEFASKVAKDIRKETMSITQNKAYYWEKTQEREEELMGEAGDVLWQLAGLCKVMGWSLEEVAQKNLDKLAARKLAGTINGRGDGISGNGRQSYDGSTGCK
jgi:NTP pyrophosphatase (non-canonical NTP hydrolase)